MSLILEALRKLERDKPAPERGVVVMTTAGLAPDRPGAPAWLWLAMGLACGGAVTVAVLAGRGTPPATAEPTRPPMAAAAAPAVAAPATTVPTAARPAILSAPGPASPPPPTSARPPAAPAPPAEPAASPPAPAALALVLQAITTQDGRPVALINDRVLREGDAVDGVRVLRIGEAEVEVEANGVRRTLRF